MKSHRGAATAVVSVIVVAVAAVALTPSLSAQAFQTRWQGLRDLDLRCAEVDSVSSAVQRALPDGGPERIARDRVLADAHEVGIDAAERVVAARLDVPTVADGWFTFAPHLRSACDIPTPVYPTVDADSAEYAVTGTADSIDVNLRAGWLYANVGKLRDGGQATVTVGGRSFPVRPHSPTEIGVGVSGADTIIVVRRGRVVLGTGQAQLVIGAGQEWRASRGDVLDDAPKDALRSVDRIGIEEWMGWPSRAWRAVRERPVWQQALGVGLAAWGVYELVRPDSYHPPSRAVGISIRFP